MKREKGFNRSFGENDVGAIIEFLIEKGRINELNKNFYVRKRAMNLDGELSLKEKTVKKKKKYSLLCGSSGDNKQKLSHCVRIERN